jgi:hypothetical protein
MWVAIIIVAVLYFTPQVMQSFRQAAFYRQQALNAQLQNNRALPTGAVSPAMPVVPGNPVMPTARPAPSLLVGTFQGQQMQAGHRVCNLVLEMREGAPGVLGGYAKLTCYPLAIPGQSGYPQQNVAAQWEIGACGKGQVIAQRTGR